MEYPEGHRNYYAGAWLVSPDGKAHHRSDIGGFPDSCWTRRELDRYERRFPVGSEFLLYDVGPGDTVRTMNWTQGKCDVGPDENIMTGTMLAVKAYLKHWGFRAAACTVIFDEGRYRFAVPEIR
jgi:hypothetical protein